MPDSWVKNECAGNMWLSGLRKHHETLCLRNPEATCHTQLRYYLDGLGIDSRWCHWGFFSVATDKTMCPGVDSASKNEYQGFLLG